MEEDINATYASVADYHCPGGLALVVDGGEQLSQIVGGTKKDINAFDSWEITIDSDGNLAPVVSIWSATAPLPATPAPPP